MADEIRALEPVVTEWDEPDAALRALNEAVGRHGITLPSARVDPVSVLSPHMEPMIDVGRLRLSDVRALTKALACRGPR